MSTTHSSHNETFGLYINLSKPTIYYFGNWIFYSIFVRLLNVDISEMDKYFLLKTVHSEINTDIIFIYSEMY